MANLDTMNLPNALARWRELVWPREHGSWSLALEPIVLGLLVAPSPAGAWFAGAVLAAFFARRPLRTAVCDANPARRAEARGPLAAIAVGALGCLAGALALGGAGWLVWLGPAALAGAAFLHFDLRNDGRAEAAEVAGASAFAWLPAVFAALAGWSPAEAAALAVAMLGRAVPAVLGVRAVLREAKTGVRRIAPALVAAAVALVAGVVLAQAVLAPRAVAVLLAILGVRTVALLVWPRPALRARTLGMIETVLGVAFVVTAAIAWRAA